MADHMISVTFGLAQFTLGVIIGRCIWKKARKVAKTVIFEGEEEETLRNIRDYCDRELASRSGGEG